MSVLEIDEAVREVDAPDEGPLVSHIGRVGDRRGLCGAPTLGIPAVNPPATCGVCEEIWAARSSWRQWLFRHRFWRVG